MKEQLETLVRLMVERGILFEEAVGELEKKFIKQVLEHVHGNQCRAAQILGIHRNTLSRKIAQYKLSQPKQNSRKLRKNGAPLERRTIHSDYSPSITGS